jgi:hypothetical protein
MWQTLKYNPASWRVPYNVQVFKDPKQILVTYALQVSTAVLVLIGQLILLKFLLVTLLYTIPEDDPAHTKKSKLYCIHKVSSR